MFLRSNLNIKLSISCVLFCELGFSFVQLGFRAKKRVLGVEINIFIKYVSSIIVILVLI